MAQSEYEQQLITEMENKVTAAVRKTIQSLLKENPKLTIHELVIPITIANGGGAVAIADGGHYHHHYGKD